MDSPRFAGGYLQEERPVIGLQEHAVETLLGLRPLELEERG